VHVIALGKAAPDMARGALDALDAAGLTAAGGLVVTSHRPEFALPLPLRVGDHPLPDIGSLAAADAIASAIAQVDAGDEVLVLVSGGTTALCAAPCAELVSLVGHPADAQRLLAHAMDAMLARGMAIHEMNAIRRRLLRWGGGRLATALAARGVGHVRVLAISDVIGDDPAVIGSGPCSADPLQHDDVLALCDAHGLRGTLDAPLLRALGLAGSGAQAIEPPAPSHAAFQRVSFTVIAGNREACEAAAEAARGEGMTDVFVADDALQGEAESVGGAIARVALRQALAHDGETLLVWGGEPTVTMLSDDPESGAPASSEASDTEVALPTWMRAASTETETALGGRMQVLALSAALTLDAPESVLPIEPGPMARAIASRITILAGSTDGRDGPTDAAGAVVDALTAALVRREGRVPELDLQAHRSYHALDAAGALLRTGPSGTNVMDVVLVHIRAR
jgi:hydroxypyruvate reductase